MKKKKIHYANFLLFMLFAFKQSMATTDSLSSSNRDTKSECKLFNEKMEKKGSMNVSYLKCHLVGPNHSVLAKNPYFATTLFDSSKNRGKEKQKS